MKSPKVDYTGMKINHLTVVRYIPANERAGYSKDKDTRRWLCKCVCGKYVRVRSDQVNYSAIELPSIKRRGLTLDSPRA